MSENHSKFVGNFATKKQIKRTYRDMRNVPVCPDCQLSQQLELFGKWVQRMRATMYGDAAGYDRGLFVFNCQLRKKHIKTLHRTPFI